MASYKRGKTLFLFVSMFLFVLLVACNHDKVDDSTIFVQETLQEEENANGDRDDPIDSASPKTGSGVIGPFWKVVHENNIVYLFGSIHVGKPELYPLHDKVELAFAESDVLAVEADVLNINLFSMQRLIDERAKYTDGTSLRDHLTPYHYARVKKAFQDQGLSLAMFESYEPWYLSMLLDSLYMLRTDYDEELGVDMYFLKKANGVKDIHELEGIEFQLDMMDNFSEELQVVQLLSSLSYKEDQYQEELDRLFEAWKSSSEEDLLAFVSYPEDLTDHEHELMEEYYKALLDDRNVGMVDKIEAYLTNSDPKTYFVVVGAAHYVGEKGIVQLLTERGYDVKRVTP